MKELTDDQVERLPSWVQDKWETSKRHERNYGYQYRHFTTDPLIIELAHALEQVAAAKLMAEALEAEDNYRHSRLEITPRIMDADLLVEMKYEKILHRYWHLVEGAKRQALAAWKALEIGSGWEIEQDGESGGA